MTTIDQFEVPLTLRTGDDETVVITLTDGAGAPINLTGRTYAAQIRRSPSDADALASFSVALTPASGIITLSMGRALTTALTPGWAVWDLQETASGGTVTTTLGGRVEIVRDVTR